MSRFTYAIGDLHGRFDLLLKALSLCEGDAAKRGAEAARLIVLGDFVDRGPASRSIIECLMDGTRGAGLDWIVLQGNHEAMMLEVLEWPTDERMRWWVGNGGGQTLMSYGYRQGDELRPLKVPGDHLKWLAELPIWIEDDHRIFVHAGVPFDQPVRDARRDTLQWMLYPGDVPDSVSAERHSDRPHCSGKHIVHGHHQSASHPLLLPHRTNLDSFAWRTGRAAIGVFDDALPGGPIAILDAIGEPMP